MQCCRFGLASSLQYFWRESGSGCAGRQNLVCSASHARLLPLGITSEAEWQTVLPQKWRQSVSYRWLSAFSFPRFKFLLFLVLRLQVQSLFSRMHFLLKKPKSKTDHKFEVHIRKFLFWLQMFILKLFFNNLVTFKHLRTFTDRFLKQKKISIFATIRLRMHCTVFLKCLSWFGQPT